MKAAAVLMLFLLSGCANGCPECITLTPAQLGAAMEKAWAKGYGQGFKDGEDAVDVRKLKSL